MVTLEGQPFLRHGTSVFSPPPCKHDIWPASSCTWCNGKETPVHPKSPSSTRAVYPFAARFAGTCVVCHESISKGDIIVKVTSSKGSGYAHVDHLTEEEE